MTDIEYYLVLFIAVIVICLVVDFFAKSSITTILGGAISSAISDTTASPEQIEGGRRSRSPRKDNLEETHIDPFGLSHKIRKTYDEYDDPELINKVNRKIIHTFDNVVIDGNNFLYRFREDVDKTTGTITTKEMISYMQRMVKLLHKHFPKKSLYFVFKDPETKDQEDDLMKHFKVKTIKQAHKKLFNDLTKGYPNVNFVIAYGEEKYRDDYAAIWLADVLPTDTILLSRDRYKDVGEMKSSSIKFKAYGKKTNKLNKILNKPFNYITKGSVKTALIGYSFDSNTQSGFYDKTVNQKSQASDVVYIFKM
jgi:hypothetical protein